MAQGEVTRLASNTNLKEIIANLGLLDLLTMYSSMLQVPRPNAHISPSEPKATQVHAYHGQPYSRTQKYRGDMIALQQ